MINRSGKGKRERMGQEWMAGTIYYGILYLQNRMGSLVMPSRWPIIPLWIRLKGEPATITNGVPTI